MGSKITALAYSPDGSYLSLGFQSGVLLVLDAKLDRVRLEDGTETENFMLPSLKPLMTTKEAKQTIICLKYSLYGDYLAASFANQE
jgi:hypothetical protein